MTEKVGIYVRVSTEEQAKEGISIGAQIERCEAYCKARGWQVTKVYTDAGFSAGTTNRPALKELLEDIDQKKFSTLLVYKIDRFSRNLKDLISILDDLKKKGVHFTSVTEQIDTTTAMGEAFFQIIGVFAQLERGMVKERVKMAFGKKVSSGEIMNRAPLGYTYKDRKLVVDPEKAKVIKDIFNMWASGVHYKEISRQFDIPVSTLYEIIKNPTYVGKIRYLGKLYEAAHPSIIGEELFNQINQKF